MKQVHRAGTRHGYFHDSKRNVSYVILHIVKHLQKIAQLNKLIDCFFTFRYTKYTKCEKYSSHILWEIFKCLKPISLFWRDTV